MLITLVLEYISLFLNITLSFLLQGQSPRQSQKKHALPSYLHHRLTLSTPASTLVFLGSPSQQKVAIQTFPPKKLLPPGFQRMKKELWLHEDHRIQATPDQAKDRNYRPRCTEPCLLLLLVSGGWVIGSSGLPAQYSPEEARKGHQEQSLEIK